MTSNATTTEAPATTPSDGATSEGTSTMMTSPEATTAETQTDATTVPPETTDAEATTETDGADKTGTKTEDTTKAKESGAPETYAEFAMPEGVTIDTAKMEAFQGLAKKYGLSQEAAQAFADLGANVALESAGKPQQVVEQAKETWKKDAIADTEFGGVKVAENLSVAKKALDTFGTPELRDMLDVSGLGNHPEVIRLFYRIGQNISEDGMFTGTATNHNAPKSAAEHLYGNPSKP